MRARAGAGIEQAVQDAGGKRRGVRRDVTQWAKLIETQRRSALTVVDFCRQRRIAKATFWYWRKRLAGSAKQEQLARPVPRFIALPLVAPVTQSVELDLKTQCLKLDSVAAAQIIAAVVERIAQAVPR